MNKKLIFWLLGASLALNLFLVGFVAAQGLKGHRHPAPSGDFHRGGPFRVWHILKETQKPELRDKLRGELKQMRPERQALRQARREVQVQLKADPFDSEALARALQDLRGQTEKNQARMHTLMVEIAKELTPEERRKLAEENWAPARRGGKDRRPPRNRPE